MTNLIDKQHLMAALDQTREYLNNMRSVCERAHQMGGDGQALAANRGAAGVIAALQRGIAAGLFDARDENDLDIVAVVRYSEDEADDTEDMAPEEEPGAGTIMLPPCPSPEEMAELREWYESRGYITKNRG